MPTDWENAVAIAVETSGRIGSVAVGRGAAVLAADSFSTRLQHGVELLPTADRLCRAAGLAPDMFQQVYVSGGPGSFTGLRIGVSFAKAMAFAMGAKVVRVPTLHVIAQNALELASPPARVVVILDAKRGHIYAATFERSGAEYIPFDAPDERDPGVYLPSCGPVAALGEGIVFHKQAVGRADNVNVLPVELNRARAEVVYRLGRQMAAAGKFTPIGELIPIYIRRPEAEEKWGQRHDQGRP